MSVLTVTNLRAWYVTRAFGIEREVRAVDDVSLAVERNEIYGLAGEFELWQIHADQDDRRGDTPPFAGGERQRDVRLRRPANRYARRDSYPTSRRYAGAICPTLCRVR